MHNNYTLDVRLLKKIIFPSEDRYTISYFNTNHY